MPFLNNYLSIGYTLTDIAIEISVRVKRRRILEPLQCGLLIPLFAGGGGGLLLVRPFDP